MDGEGAQQGERLVADVASPGGERVRAAEVIAALSLATDLGIGVPLEHGLQSTLVAMRLGERLGVDPDTASQTYYACLLFYVGCTADAEAAAETFGDDDALTTLCHAGRFGSRPEMMAGIMRALADAGRPAPVRAMQIARGLPRAAREFKGHVAAFCEVAQMLTDRLGLPASMQGLFAYLVERWDGKGLPGRARHEEIPLPVRIASVARDAAFQRLLGGPEFAAQVVRRRAGGAFDPAVAIPLADAGPGAPGPRRRRVRLGGDARLRAWPAVDPGGRGDRPCPGGDGRLRRPCLAVPGRPLGRGRRAGHGGGPALPSRGRRPGAGPARRAGPRSRARGGPGPHLAEGGAAHARRLGAGQAARLPRRARPHPLPVPGRARACCRLPPRASGRLGLPPGNRRRRARAAGAPARRRRRLPRDDRTHGRTGRRARPDRPPRPSAGRPVPDGSTPTPSPRCWRRPGNASHGSGGRRG